jgi:isopenicillin N synthase-like dioxygenase
MRQSANAEIPVLDFNDWKRGGAGRVKLVDEVMDASTRFGFMQWRNAMSSGHIAELFRQGAKFHAISDTLKKEIAYDRRINRGLDGLGDQTFPGGKGDRKKSFRCGFPPIPGLAVDPATPYADLARGDNIWPPEDTVPGFRSVIERHLQFTAGIVRTQLMCLELGLGMSPGSLTNYVLYPQWTLRLIFYPGEAEMGPLKNGQEPCHVHVDWNMVTILIQDRTGGLFVMIDGERIPVAPREGCIVVNFGTMLQALTDNRIKATEHGVMPAAESRQSCAVFAYADLQSKIPVLTGDARQYVESGVVVRNAIDGTQRVTA